ncbi:TPA: UDP-N-acetylglucosamine 2-epimerase, partial [Pseudomonas aeruginosa]
LKLEVQVIDPVGYLEMIWLLQRSGLVLTDSGGVQKEAFFFGKPCVTMRDQTEWVELVTCGANVLVGAARDMIVESARTSLGKTIQDDGQLYGGGQASSRIAEYLAKL